MLYIPGSSPESCILFQNDDRTINLVDIPASLRIALHGNIIGLEPNTLPYSTPALKVPYSIPEPKRNGSSQHIHSYLQAAEVHNCLAKIRDHVRSQLWCSPRPFVKSDKADAALKLELICEHDGASVLWSDLVPQMLPLGGGDPLPLSRLQKRVVCNPHNNIAVLGVLDLDSEFYLPPYSKFLLSRINSESWMDFSMAALHLFPEPSSSTNAGPGQFDLIVLDPPWQNRSVKRSFQYGLPTAEDDPVEALSPIMDQHLAIGSFVACWVTNSQSVWRKAQELFRHWHLELAETWFWLKVTSEGQSVVDPQSQWRKPYETLLIGKKGEPGPDCESLDDFEKHAKKRFIAATPDLHSRKPNLKEVFDQILFHDHVQYRALEIFARSLTAEWLAWGDEVLKFNHAKAWPASTGVGRQSSALPRGDAMVRD